jgi:tetratricopeptide (TPR) repeat protein
MKIPVILFLSFLIWGCNSNADSSSPFDEILSQPPFASITDSIRKQPGRDDLYFRRAVLLNKNNLPEPALVDFRKAWSIAPVEPYAVGVSTILLEKKPDSAILFLKKAIEEIPTSIFLQLSLARVYDTQGKTDEALTACNNLLQNEPQQVNTLMLKSDLLLKKEDTSAAIRALEQAYHFVPSNREISNKLAYQYAETKNSKAILLADSLIRKDSLKLFAEPYYVKGMYYTNINDREKAIQQFDATIKQDHRFLNAYIEKGKILFDQKKTAEALKTFELANTITPSFPDAWYWIGRCQEIAGQKEEAKLNYEKAYSLDKTFTEAKDAAEKIVD